VFMEVAKFVKINDISDRINSLFESEEKKLSELFPTAKIEHIGSTAILGSITKGDLDINIRVQSDEFAGAVRILEPLYEINQRENWSKEFASFKDDSRDLGIQVTVLGSPDDYFVTQRDYLKGHPEAVSELNNLKEQFEGKDMDEYRKVKGEFFENLNANFSP